MYLAVREIIRTKLLTHLVRMPKISPPDSIVLNSHLEQCEALITYLKEEIKQLVSAVNTRGGETVLQEENRKLENEIKAIKKELISLQIANGVPQIPIPGEGLASTTAVRTSGEDESSLSISGDSVLRTSGEYRNIVRTSGEGKEKQEYEPTSKDIAVNSGENKTIKAPKPKKQTAAVGEEPPIDVGRLDIRVGKILHAQVHPDATQLYIEQIDVGDEISRTVVSGLVQHVALPELDGRMVVVLCNLKPQKMRGIVSEAMVLCASTPETVELLIPPLEARAGDNITVPGFPRNPDLPFMNPKKKIFDKVAEDLIVNDKKQASYKGIPWKVEGREGFVTVQALSGCYIR